MPSLPVGTTEPSVNMGGTTPTSDFSWTPKDPTVRFTHTCLFTEASDHPGLTWKHTCQTTLVLGVLALLPLGWAVYVYYRSESRLDRLEQSVFDPASVCAPVLTHTHALPAPRLGLIHVETGLGIQPSKGATTASRFHAVK